MQPDSISIELVDFLREQDPGGHRLARVFRETFDQAYDGARTGRFKPEQLSKTERAHIGSLVEINIRREFDGLIHDGSYMDYEIAGHEVDCKYSKNPFGWMIPNETIGHHAMVCHADDRKATWRVGFVGVRQEILTSGGNRDQKRSIRQAGRSAISWAWYDAPLPPNTLLQLENEEVEKIMTPRSGQQRLNNLFRIAQQMVIPRGIVATVAMQKDYMKRLRYNGGSRSALQPEGIVILGDYIHHQNVARELGLPVPGPGDTVSTRLTPLKSGETSLSVLIEGTYWRIAHHHDPVVPAPRIPNTKTSSLIEMELGDLF